LTSVTVLSAGEASVGWKSISTGGRAVAGGTGDSTAAKTFHTVRMPERIFPTSAALSSTGRAGSFWKS
jgi:hypothetical protein